MKDVIVEQVVDKYQRRSELGLMKYGTTLAQNNKDNYLVHLQQELMDASLYIEKLLSLEREITILVKNHPNDADLGEAVRKLIR
jgi:hypothetical protein